jgi:hypothetical protein
VRLFLVQALVVTIIALVAAAFVFRSSRARRTLDLIRDGIVLYVLAILAVGLFTYFMQRF